MRFKYLPLVSRRLRAGRRRTAEFVQLREFKQGWTGLAGLAKIYLVNLVYPCKFFMFKSIRFNTKCALLQTHQKPKF